mgnify:CR=1 FL=1
MRPAESVVSDLVSIEELDDNVSAIAARINIATYELITLIREFDERAGFLKWGFENCAEWLAWRCDFSMATAREKVRAARALKTLPLVTRAFATGELSWSKVRELTRVANERDEDDLVEHHAVRVLGKHDDPQHAGVVGFQETRHPPAGAQQLQHDVGCSMCPAQNQHVTGKRDRSCPRFDALDELVHPLGEDGDQQTEKQQVAEHRDHRRDRTTDKPFVVAQIAGIREAEEGPPYRFADLVEAGSQHAHQQAAEQRHQQHDGRCQQQPVVQPAQEQSLQTEPQLIKTPSALAFTWLHGSPFP